ncbi:MAG: SH3 domain-containing protein [Rhodopila sp.]|nr:SH3 domain-containing protein [Rhodopila sp.]
MLAWLLAAGSGAAWAQTGTLQVPAKPPREQPIKPPAAAPREPVHKVGPASTPKTPVVPPHGPTHPHKPVPAAAAVPAKPPQPALPVTPPAKPAETDADTKAAQPEKLPDPEKPDGAPSKLPRFVSLRSDDVNMRAGPGTRYRIDWVYKRRDLPVEIEREFDVWRWVRDADGIQGWVHQATLMGRRSFIVQKADATLRSDASDTASAVAILKPGVIGRIRSCAASSDWCNVQTGSYRGFLRREQFWGVLPGEAIVP